LLSIRPGTSGEALSTRCGGQGVHSGYSGHEVRDRGSAISVTILPNCVDGRTINAAASHYVGGSMLNYVTLQGVHVIVRLDLVDRGPSRDLIARGLQSSAFQSDHFLLSQFLLFEWPPQ